MAGSPKDTIGQASGGHHVQDLEGRAMAVAAEQERGVGPAMTPGREATGPHHGMLRARGASPGPEGRHHAGLRRPRKDQEGQRARARGMLVRDGACLLAMGGISRVLQSEPEGGGGRSVTGETGVHTGRGESREVCAVDTVCEP